MKQKWNWSKIIERHKNGWVDHLQIFILSKIMFYRHSLEWMASIKHQLSFSHTKTKSFRSVGFQQQKKLPWKLLTIGLADVARHANHLWGKKAHILSDKQKSQYGEINQVTAFRKCHWEYSFFFMKWHGLFFPSAQLTHKHRFALLKYLG